MKTIADHDSWATPATIEDPKALEEIAAALEARAGRGGRSSNGRPPALGLDGLRKARSGHVASKGGTRRPHEINPVLLARNGAFQTLIADLRQKLVASLVLPRVPVLSSRRAHEQEITAGSVCQENVGSSEIHRRGRGPPRSRIAGLAIAATLTVTSGFSRPAVLAPSARVNVEWGFGKASP